MQMVTVLMEQRFLSSCCVDPFAFFIDFCAYFNNYACKSAPSKKARKKKRKKNKKKLCILCTKYMTYIMFNHCVSNI